MQITTIEIQKFRSIVDLKTDTSALTVVCGPNSCGKSNVLRALKFALLPSYDEAKSGSNLCNLITGPNSTGKIKITFDAPNAALAHSLNLTAGIPFSYMVQFKKNGKVTTYLNGTQITPEIRAFLLAEIVVVDVPPIRDLSSGGLEPFRSTLATIIRRTRGPSSIANLDRTVRRAIVVNGNSFLAPTQLLAKSMLNIDRVMIDADQLSIEQLLPKISFRFKANQQTLSLDKLGTGHQSTILLSLYRELGTATGKFVLFLFEEPDNHLHPTALCAVAEDLRNSAVGNAQTFVTTHSPRLLNQFPIESLLVLQSGKDRSTSKRPMKLTLNDRALRIALGNYGLVPAEALLCRKILVVEGLNDVTMMRVLIELSTGKTADRHDVLIVPANGKDPLVALCILLDQIGANWSGILDWDATIDTSQPIFVSTLTAADKVRLTGELTSVLSSLSQPGTNQTKPQKFVANLIAQLSAPPLNGTPQFFNSVLGRYVVKSNGLSAFDQTRLANAVKAKRPRVIRSLLKTLRLTLWSDAPENLLLGSANAETIAERILLERGLIAANYPVAVRRVGLYNRLHDLAHVPEALDAIVRELWNTGELSREEITHAINAAIA